MAPPRCREAGATRALALLLLLVLPGCHLFAGRVACEPGTRCGASQRCGEDGFCPPARDHERPSREGLVALYTFLEGEGRAVLDVSGEGEPVDLSFIGEPEWLPDGGLRFGAPSTFVTSLEPARKVYDALTASEAFSVEVWVEPHNLVQEDNARIFSYSEGVNGNQRNLQVTQDFADLNVRTYGLRVGSLPDQLRTRTQHLVASYESELVRFFVDGELKGTAELRPTFDNWSSESHLQLGNEVTSNRQWRGDLYLVAVYDRTLSAEEVGQLYEGGTP